MDTSTLVIIVVGLLFLGLIWRIVRGVIRLVLTVGVILVIVYVVMNMLR